MKRRFWTPEDDEFLMRNFDTMPFAELCRHLGRKPMAVGSRCRTLGIEPMGKSTLTDLSKAWFK